MIRALVVLLSMFAATVYGISAQKADETTQQELKAIATTVIENFEKGNFEAVTELFTDQLKEMVKKDMLAGNWEIGMPKQLGKYLDHDDAVYLVVKGFDIVDIVCRFEKDKIKLRLQFNEKKDISGLAFVPA